MKDKNKFLKKSLDLNKIRQERTKEVSQQALYKFSEKCVRTTMIGALDAIAKKFGFLWGFESEEDLNEEQKILKEMYEEVRAIILDKGNNQIRFLNSEFSDYDITRKRYQINLPVIGAKEEKKNDGKI